MNFLKLGERQRYYNLLDLYILINHWSYSIGRGLSSRLFEEISDSNKLYKSERTSI